MFQTYDYVLIIWYNFICVTTGFHFISYNFCCQKLPISLLSNYDFLLRNIYQFFKKWSLNMLNRDLAYFFNGSFLPWIGFIDLLKIFFHLF